MADPSPLRIAVLDDYQAAARTLADWGSLGADVSVVAFHDHADREAVAARLADYDVALIREQTPIDATLIAALPRLKLLVTMGCGTQRWMSRPPGRAGFRICGTADGDPEATPNLAWGLILALTRGIALEAAPIRASGWQIGIGQDIAGGTLGILGLGKIGERMAQIGRAFGMAAIAWSPNLTTAAAAEVGVGRVEKDALFRRPDVLTIHLKLGERSRGIVGARELGLMRSEAFLVNTSRGPIVDEVALIAVLTEHRIARAALDVFDTEPLAPATRSATCRTSSRRPISATSAAGPMRPPSRRWSRTSRLGERDGRSACWRGSVAAPDQAASRICCMACTTSSGRQGFAMNCTWSGRSRAVLRLPEVTMTPICGQ